MIYKKYGKTGNMVSAVGFGGMRFDTSKSHEENADLVLYAVDKGINYLDTAPSYCNSTSEDIMGLAISKINKKRGDFFVSTKLMPHAGKNKQDFIDAVKKSIERTKSDYIDFYHIWCLRKMEHYEHAMKPGMQYEALLEMQQQGLVKHIVCSSHQPGNEIRQIVEDGKVEGVLMGVNILNSAYRWEGVDACIENNLGTVAMNPLGGGSIPTHEEQFQFLCREGETAVEAALRFTISSPITVTLNGFTTKEHVTTACKVADNAQPFGTNELAEIRKNLGENMNSSCTACGYCLKDCPMDINIAAYMQIYNEHIMFGKTEEELTNNMEFQNTFGSLASRTARAEDCIQCGICENICTQHLNIIERLAVTAKWEAGIKRG